MEPLPRSYLFVPGNRPDRFEKACAAGADAVIIDLEDAVPPPDKAAARDAVANWAVGPDFNAHHTPVLLRINGADTEWFAEDLAVCGLPAISAIVLPKAESVGHLRLMADRIGTDAAILPLIETARGFGNIRNIAESRHVARLVFGSIDFQLDLGMNASEEELLYFRCQIVLASRLAGIQPPVDGVTLAVDDPQRLRDDAARARRLGFGAKLCIHPRQIAVVHEALAPSADELSWARRVVEAAAASGGNAALLDGKMMDKPVIARADAILRSRR